jgi:hypothetical protein
MASIPASRTAALASARLRVAASTTDDTATAVRAKTTRAHRSVPEATSRVCSGGMKK